MKIQEILFEGKHDDWDDEMDDVPSDPDSDKVPHILMQMKKALDVGGNYPITFKDGSKVKVTTDEIEKFVSRYMELKPMDREKMQDLASQSHENFVKIIHFFDAPKAEKSLYQRAYN
jgi:hypothetical protein